MNMAYLFILGLLQFLLAEFSTVQRFTTTIVKYISKYFMLLKPM